MLNIVSLLFAMAIVMSAASNALIASTFAMAGKWF